MRWLRLVCLLLTAVLSPMAYPECSHPRLDTSRWQGQDLGRFTLQVPPGYHRDKVRGSDSQVGRWSGKEEWLLFDFGPYTAAPSDLERHPEVEVCKESIGGWPALLVTYRKPDGSHAVTAHWADTGNGDKRLNLYGEAREIAGRDRLLTAARSTRFEP